MRAKVLQEAASNPLIQQLYAAREAKEHRKAAATAATAAAATAAALVFPSGNPTTLDCALKTNGGSSSTVLETNFYLIFSAAHLNLGKSDWLDSEKSEESRAELFRETWRGENKLEAKFGEDHKMEEQPQNEQLDWREKRSCLADQPAKEPRMADEEPESMPLIEDRTAVTPVEEPPLDLHPLPSHVLLPPNQTLSIQIHDFQPFQDAHRPVVQQQHFHFTHQHLPPPAPSLNHHANQVHQQSQTSLQPEVSPIKPITAQSIWS